jgi:two-component system chemotaxis response regulator CheY
MSGIPPPSHHALATALIVDDSFYARDIYAIALRQLGYQVVEADDGAKALAALQHDTFDLMVLDLSMEIIDGGTVLKEVRSNGLHKNMPIVVATAHPALVTDAVGAAASRVMYKPLNIREFIGYVKTLRERGPATS